MTSMSHQHHQTATSWHPATPTATGAIVQAPPSYHNHIHGHLNNHHHHLHQADHEPTSYPLNIDMANEASNQPISGPNNNQYNLVATQRGQNEQQPIHSTAGSPGAPTPTLTSDLTAAQTAQLSSSYMVPTPTAPSCRKSSPATLIKVEAMISPDTHHQHHLQDSYQESSMIAAHDHQRHHQDHHHQQPQQQQQHLYQQQARPNQSNNNNYYDSSYQDQCHQDYYNMINPGHRANLDPFQQPSPAAIGAGAHQANASAQCWPNLSQSTSPQIATSPAINNHQFHLGAHQTPPSLPASISPYHTNHQNATYSNGYPPQAPPPSHPPHQPQQQQRLQQSHQQQQHYIPHQQHSHHHHHAIIQSSHISDEVFSHRQHQVHLHAAPIAYNQFSHRASVMTNSPKQHQTTTPTMPPTQMFHNTQMMQHQQSAMRHYSATGSGGGVNINLIDTKVKVEPTSSENLALNTRATSMSVISSPKQQHQNLLSSPPGINNGPNVSRRQSSSVVSTASSAGSNLSDHHSPTESPSSVPPSQNVSTSLNSDQTQISATNNIKVSGASRLVSGDDRLVTNATDTEQDSKESQLSQLHQQCAVLLDEQQQQHNIAINSPNSNNNGTNASNSANNNNNISSNSNPSSNGNNTGRSKRLRTSFKHNQLKEMKRWFCRNQNPDAKDLKTLAQTTGLSKRVLQVWFQNARAKFRRNNAKAANQQLYDVNQHTSHMLQFQQQQQQHQQQNYHHHHHHHHHPRPMTDNQPINSQQIGQHHHLPNQGSPTPIARTFAPLTGGGSEGVHQIGTVANNLIDQQQPSTTATTTSG